MDKHAQRCCRHSEHRHRPGGIRTLHCSRELRQAAKLCRPECLPWRPTANSIFTMMMPWVDKSFEWSPWTSFVYNEMQVQFTNLFSGKITTDQALQNLQDKVEGFARAQGFQ